MLIGTHKRPTKADHLLDSASVVINFVGNVKKKSCLVSKRSKKSFVNSRPLEKEPTTESS